MIGSFQVLEGLSLRDVSSLHAGGASRNSGGAVLVWSASQLLEAILGADLAPVALNREVSDLAGPAPEEGRDI